MMPFNHAVTTVTGLSESHTCASQEGRYLEFYVTPHTLVLKETPILRPTSLSPLR